MIRMFPTERAARLRLWKSVWSDGPVCHYCGSADRVAPKSNGSRFPARRGSTATSAAQRLLHCPHRTDKEADRGRTAGRVERAEDRAGADRPRRTGRGVTAQAPKIRRLARAQRARRASGLQLPEAHRLKMRTTNGIERPVKHELKRRTRKIRVFPDVDSLMRFAASLLAEIDEEWFNGNVYVTWDREDD